VFSPRPPRRARYSGRGPRQSRRGSQSRPPPRRPLAAWLGLVLTLAIAAIFWAIFRILRDAIWRPVWKAITNAVVLAIAALLGLGLLRVVADQPELLRLLLAIGILVLALRLIWRRVRDVLRFKL